MRTHNGFVEEGETLHRDHRLLGLLWFFKDHPGLAPELVRSSGHDIYYGAKLLEDAAHRLFQVCSGGQAGQS